MKEIKIDLGLERDMLPIDAIDFEFVLGKIFYLI